MMSKLNETSSVKALVTWVAMSALSLTTTVNNSGMTYAPQTILIDSYNNINDISTASLMPKKIEIKEENSYEQATKLFGVKMRDFTKDESERYQKSLEKIYKPTGVNILDLC